MVRFAIKQRLVRLVTKCLSNEGLVVSFIGLSEKSLTKEVLKEIGHKWRHYYLFCYKDRYFLISFKENEIFINLAPADVVNKIFKRDKTIKNYRYIKGE